MIARLDRSTHAQRSLARGTRLALAAVAALALCGAARAADVCGGRPLALGVGVQQSCAAYLAAPAGGRSVADAWILGAISGANLYAPKFNAVGSTRTVVQTLADVGHLCRIMPERPVADAVAVYLRELTRDCTGDPAAPSAAAPGVTLRGERRA